MLHGVRRSRRRLPHGRPLRSRLVRGWPLCAGRRVGFDLGVDGFGVAGKELVPVPLLLGVRGPAEFFACGFVLGLVSTGELGSSNSLVPSASFLASVELAVLTWLSACSGVRPCRERNSWRRCSAPSSRVAARAGSRPANLFWAARNSGSNGRTGEPAAIQSFTSWSLSCGLLAWACPKTWSW